MRIIRISLLCLSHSYMDTYMEKGIAKELGKTFPNILKNLKSSTKQIVKCHNLINKS